MPHPTGNLDADFSQAISRNQNLKCKYCASVCVCVCVIYLRCLRLFRRVPGGRPWAGMRQLSGTKAPHRHHTGTWTLPVQGLLHVTSNSHFTSRLCIKVLHCVRHKGRVSEESLFSPSFGCVNSREHRTDGV